MKKFSLTNPGEKRDGQRDDKRDDKDTPPRKRHFLLEAEDDDDEDAPTLGGSSSANTSDRPTVPQGPRRHFANRQNLMSGPGTLNSNGAFPPVNNSRPPQTQGQLASTQNRTVQPAGMSASHRTQQQAASSTNPPANISPLVEARATNIPHGTSVELIKVLFSDYPDCPIKHISVVPNQGPQYGRPSITMAMTFESQVTHRDLSAAVNGLHKKAYLTRGYYLHLDSYSPWAHPDPPKPPFGAQYENKPGVTTDKAKHPNQNHGPDKELVVRVQRPNDLATLRLIHMAVEGTVICGPEYETALMADSRVMQQERFAWLYDQNHEFAPYYRWTIHRLLTGSNKPCELYGRECGMWYPPAPIPDEFACFTRDIAPTIDELADADDEGGRYGGLKAQMVPLRQWTRTLLMWLLSRMSDKPATRSDVAGVTTVCVDNANEDIHEVVELLVTNLVQPFALKRLELQGRKKDEINLRELTTNALFLITDLAQYSLHPDSLYDSTSGNVWKYRELLEKALVERGVFAHLGKFPVKAELGVTSAKQFTEQVEALFTHWSNDALFDKRSLDGFKIEFYGHLDKDQNKPEADARTSTKRKLSIDEEDEVLQTVTGNSQRFKAAKTEAKGPRLLG